MKPTQQCAYHPNQQIINFCKSQTCLMPLCAECIKIHTIEHSQNHTYGEFETIDNVIDQCQKQMKTVQSKYTLTQQILYEMNKKVDDFEEQLLKKLKNGENKLFELLESHFKNLEKDIKEKSKLCKEQYQKEIQQEYTNLTRKQEEIDQLLKKLNGKHFLQQVITLLGSPYLQECLEYEAEIEQYTKLLQSEMIDIIIDESKLYSINVELAKFIKVKNGASVFINKQQQRFADENRNKLINMRSQAKQAYSPNIQYDDYSEYSSQEMNQSFKYTSNLFYSDQKGKIWRQEKPIVQKFDSQNKLQDNYLQQIDSNKQQQGSNYKRFYPYQANQNK